MAVVHSGSYFSPSKHHDIRYTEDYLLCGFGAEVLKQLTRIHNYNAEYYKYFRF